MPGALARMAAAAWRSAAFFGAVPARANSAAAARAARAAVSSNWAVASVMAFTMDLLPQE
jgi:hypothetical protein